MLPSFLSHFSTSLEVFPGIPSQINYLHLNQHFKVSFWETPNQDAHPWFCLHLVATHPFTPSLLTFSENNHITKKFHFATNTENSKLKNQGLCFLDWSCKLLDCYGRATTSAGTWAPSVLLLSHPSHALGTSWSPNGWIPSRITSEFEEQGPEMDGYVETAQETFPRAPSHGFFLHLFG